MEANEDELDIFFYYFIFINIILVDVFHDVRKKSKKRDITAMLLKDI